MAINVFVQFYQEIGQVSIVMIITCSKSNYVNHFDKAYKLIGSALL